MGNDLETNERLRSAFFFHCFKKTQYKDITFQKKSLSLHKIQYKQIMSSIRCTLARTFRIRAQSILRKVFSVLLQPSNLLRADFLLLFINQDFDADAISVSIFIYKKTSMDLNKKHLLYLTVFFLFLSLNASGQSNSISGRVLNQNTKESVEYASVVLFKQDSVFLNGTTADSIGICIYKPHFR